MPSVDRALALEPSTVGGSQGSALVKPALTDHYGPVPPAPQAPELVATESHLHHLLNVLHHDRLIQLGFGS